MKRFVTNEDLRIARLRHLKELRLLEKMTDGEFQVFKKNFSLGLVDPDISRIRAMGLLRAMLETNMQLQDRPESSVEA